ncbi:MAG TPA: HAD family hydrolase, partial [Vicinamibacterales bacterium]|nr:HAD family hydrolase [Vicinamibacterales bacterium]
MKLGVIALDYDGTTAQHDRLDPAARDAIADARTRGITVLIVTGRSLDELRRVAGDLHFVDVVVAENGAVLHFPGNDYTTVLAAPVPAALIDELRRRGITAAHGRCLVDCATSDALQILDVIRQMELPLVLAFNRSRVMVLPQGVSKATGLQVALDMLRLSPHNAVAVGDAENDHALLQLVEVGAAVEWGSPTLQAAADLTIRGTGPSAVSQYVRTIAGSGRMPVPPKARRRLRLGYTEDGREFSLAVRGRNVLIAGDAKSGKSWIAGLLCEQLILHGYSMCVLDAEGDYRSLEALPGVTILGGEDPAPTPRELLSALRYPDRSVVIDLSRVVHDQKIDYIRSVLPALNVMRRRTGLP